MLCDVVVLHGQRLLPFGVRVFVADLDFFLYLLLSSILHRVSNGGSHSRFLRLGSRQYCKPRGGSVEGGGGGR